MPWDLFLIKVLAKKNVCGSREQYMGPTDGAIAVKCVDVQRVVDPMHSAQDPLTDLCPTCMLFWY